MQRVKPMTKKAKIYRHSRSREYTSHSDKDPNKKTHNKYKGKRRRYQQMSDSSCSSDAREDSDAMMTTSCKMQDKNKNEPVEARTGIG